MAEAEASAAGEEATAATLGAPAGGLPDHEAAAAIAESMATGETSALRGGESLGVGPGAGLGSLVAADERAANQPDPPEDRSPRVGPAVPEKGGLTSPLDTLLGFLLCASSGQGENRPLSPPAPGETRCAGSARSGLCGPFRRSNRSPWWDLEGKSRPLPLPRLRFRLRLPPGTASDEDSLCCS